MKYYGIHSVRQKVITGTLMLLLVFTFSSFRTGWVELPVRVQKTNPDSGLKDHYSDFFPVGVAVTPKSIYGEQGEFILRHFNSITAENAMKPAPLHPSPDRYFWDDADKIVNFAVDNGLKIRGHTLVWHQQSPAWFFKDSTGNQASREEVLERLHDHIKTVVGRYKGKVYAWDVVNEAVDDSESKIYRETDWFRTCGEEYIAMAFRWAHEADPHAKLFYNDYNTEFAGKRDRIYNLLKKLLSEGVPVHGIGLQGHWNIANPSESELRNTIEKFSSLGLDVQITELDVSVYKSSESDPSDNVFTKEREQSQIDKYSMIFRVLREMKGSVTGVTFWNLSDRSSWLDNFPVRGRKNYPLLFDQNLQPKKAYFEVIKF